MAKSLVVLSGGLDSTALFVAPHIDRVAKNNIARHLCRSSKRLGMRVF